MNAQTDESQLVFAAKRGRLFLSANIRDFAKLHRDWLEQGKTHSGIVLVPQQRYSPGEIVQRLLRAASAGPLTACGLFYLSNF
jgi:hypothetical protein